uniref:Uncharacterized protein n=1 Tax=Oryza barthii TaxID=65489 RepID=A0A0D3FKC2_9ORYZ
MLIPSIRRRRRKRSAEGAVSCQYLRCHLTTLKRRRRRHHATGGQILLRLASATVYHASAVRRIGRHMEELKPNPSCRFS